MRKKTNSNDDWDAFLEELKQATREVIHDKTTSKRDKNVAIANGAKLTQIKHKIAPGDEGDFFG